MSQTADDLIELGTLDEATAWAPTAKDHEADITPPWCELVLEVKRTNDGTIEPAWPLSIRAPLRRHDGEVIIQVLHEVLHPSSGGTASEQMFIELDEVVARIERRRAKGKAVKPDDIGMARGLATAIAIMRNPASYDVDEVRAEAMARHARNGHH